MREVRDRMLEVEARLETPLVQRKGLGERREVLSYCEGGGRGLAHHLQLGEDPAH